jgi:glycine betaine/choline ABC-type transport system substrate-binding protein
MVGAGLALVAVAAASYRSGSTAAIVVGSKNFTEQIILGELLAQTIEQQTGLLVDRRFNLGGTLVADEALRRGDIDVYVEYTGTALTALFNEPVGDASTVFERVRELYAGRGITMAASVGFNNTFAILVRASAAAEHGLARISDLSRIAPQWRAGFGYEFLERPDGFAGLSRTYGLRFRDAPRVMDLNLIYRALADGEIDLTAGDATSGLIEALDLTHLEDDRAYFPPYDAVPVVRSATILRYPQLAGALRRLEGRISAEDMRRMNHEVDGLRHDPRDVAHRFLAAIVDGGS